MRSCVFVILCILAFVSPQDAGKPIPRTNSATSSPTRSQNLKTPPSYTAVPKRSRKVPTSSLTHRSHSGMSSPTRSQKKPSSYTTVPKSSGRGPTKYPTIPTYRPTRYPAITQSPTLISASKTLTVSNGQTASAEVGWMVVGVGVGGAVAVGGSLLPVAGGDRGVIEVGSSGEVEVDPFDTTTTPTTTTKSTSRSTSSSRSTSRSSSRSSSTSSSSSSTASPTPYNIYPKLDSTLPQQSAFAQDLERIAHPGSVVRITGGRDQLLLWVASLTPAQASELSRNPVVRGINVDVPLPVDLGTETEGDIPSSQCPPESCSHGKRDGSILMQQDARDELKVISQSSGAPLSELPGYAYDARGGRGITVYVVDTGINTNHIEFRNMFGSIRWLYLPGQPETEGDNIGHGTCVASKVVSPTFGVAKSADIVVVRVDPVNGRVPTSSAIAACGVVARDITLKGLQRKAVVSTAMSVLTRFLSESDRDTYIAAIRELIDLDAPFVAASGNIRPQNPGPELATYPSLFANELPIVVVGGVETSGIRGAYSQGLPAQLTVSAVGRVLCASRQGGRSIWQGTSFAAPAVAGLAAYLMSLDRYSVQLLVPGSVARNVRDLIKSLAYARLPDQPVAIWNGIDSRDIYCPVRRDAGSSGCPARNTTLPNVPPVTLIPNPPPLGTTTRTSTTSVKFTSNPPFPSTSMGTHTSTVTSSSNLLPPSTATDSSTTSNGGKTITFTMTISDHDGFKSTLTI